MPGHTGKRAKAPQPCTICHKPIAGDYVRMGPKDDRHIECEYPNGPNGPSWTSMQGSARPPLPIEPGRYRTKNGRVAVVTEVNMTQADGTVDRQAFTWSQVTGEARGYPDYSGWDLVEKIV